jgi:acyl-CoA thioesterase FadM
MNLIFRMIWVFTAAWLKRGTERLEDTHAITLRVLPNDLDTNIHMNNGRYLTLMDIGRVDALIRTGMFQHIIREKWMPVIAGVSMIYRRSLAPFERYRLETRVLGWDERWFYMEQTFLNAKGELAARGFVKAAFLKNGQRVASDLIAKSAADATNSAAMISPKLDPEMLALFPRA